jgi:hypothetical protein
MPPRRFPPPWSVEELDACFVVSDSARQKLAYVYFEEEPGRRSAAKLLERDEARRIAANIVKLPKFSSTQNRVFPLCYPCRISREKFVMDTRFAFTLAQLLVGGYMFGACALVAHAQYLPGPPIPTAPGSNVPPPVTTAPGSNVPSPVPTAPEPSVPPPVPTAPGSSVTPPVNEPPSAARTHERTSVAKPVHHRRRSIVAGQTLTFSPRHYWDPRLPCCCCPIWSYPYGPDRLLWRWVEGRWFW